MIGAPAVPRDRREDRWCALALAVVTVYGLVLLPVRPWLLGQAPAVLAAVTGSRLGLVAVGALAAAEGTPWLWPLAGSIVSIVKFHWVFWWAGRLWGEAALTRLGGSTPRAKRRIARAEALARRYQVPALVVVYAPLPVPREVIYAVLGMSGTRLRTFLLVDLGAAAVTQAGFVALGALLGDSAVAVVRQYAVYGGAISLLVLAAMIVAAFRSRASARRSGRHRADDPASTGPDDAPESEDQPGPGDDAPPPALPPGVGDR